MCQGITDGWCALPRCSGKPIAPEFASKGVNPEIEAEKQARRIKKGEGYWSSERIRKRQGFYAVRRPLGVSFPEGRHSMKEQELNADAATREIAEFAREILKNDNLSSRDKEGLLFSAGLAHDYAIYAHSASAYLGLLRDDVPLAKRVANA